MAIQSLGLSVSKDKVKVMLRPMNSCPVCLGFRHSSGAHDEISISVKQLRACWCGTPSLTRGSSVCSLQLLLALARAVILGQGSAVLTIIFLCLGFMTPPPHRRPGPRIFISHEQGAPGVTPGVSSVSQRKKCDASVLLFLRVHILCQADSFSEPVPSNECLLFLHYFGFQQTCHYTRVRFLTTPIHNKFAMTLGSDYVIKPNTSPF
jgi:hypothetical protein